MPNLYRGRLNQLSAYLNEEAIDVALITSPINIYFFTGFFSDPHERFMALLIDVKQGITKLIVPLLDQEAAHQASYIKDVVGIKDTDDPYEQLGTMVDNSARKWAVEKGQMNLLQYERLTSRFPSLQLANLEPFLLSLRSKKSIEDIEIVKRAVRIAEQVIKHGISKVTVGMTELELTAELEYQMKVLGADRPAFATTVLTGVRSALPHGKPGQEKIKYGDFLLLDLGVFAGGYCSDITRTFVIGEATAKQTEIYNAVLEANLKAIEAVKLGEKLGQVDLAAREWIEGAGYGDYFVHRVGHGLGLEIHEAPSIHSLNQSPITPGLLFTIEPGIYVPEIGGVRIEDDIYVNENGQVDVLTTYSKELKNLC